MPLYPGKLRHRVTIQKPGKVRDPDTGENVPGWLDVDTVWADWKPASAREFIQSQAVQSEITARFTIRQRDDVDATMRISYRGKVYNIEGVLPDNESGLEWLTLPVSQGVSDGG